MSNVVKIAALAALCLTFASDAFAASKKHARLTRPQVQAAYAEAVLPEPIYFMQAKGNID